MGFDNPDQFVTVGTGTCEAERTTNERTGLSRALYECSLRPALSHYIAITFDGKKASDDLRLMLSIAGREPERWYRRFDLPLQQSLPDLADTSAMNDLAVTARTYFASDKRVNDVAMGLLASNFYLKLVGMPTYRNGLFVCYGRILSRISVSNPAFTSFFQRLDDLGAHFMIPGLSQRQKTPSILITDHVGNFSRPITLRVKELEKEVDIRLSLSDKRSYSISAMPCTIQSFVERQKLDWVHPRHAIPHHSSCGKRRRHETVDSAPTKAIKRSR
jgi:hypothetical protein